MSSEQLKPLIDHLATLQDISPKRAEHLVEEVVAFFDESVESFVRRRHGELKAQGLRNDQIYDIVTDELSQWRFKTSSLSPRQLRRIIYEQGAAREKPVAIPE